MQFSKLLSYIPEHLTRENTEKQFNVYRIILILSASFPILLRQLFLENNRQQYDPFNIKIFFAVVLFATFIASYIKYLRSAIPIFVILLLYIYTQYSVYLIGKNDIEIDYVLEFVLFLVVASRAFNNKNLLMLYFALTTVFFNYTCFVYLDSQSEILSYMGLLLVFIISIGIFFESKIRLENQEGFKSILLHTVFNDSLDAILLVNEKSGTVEECNDKALTLFDLPNKESVVSKSYRVLLGNVAAFENNNIFNAPQKEGVIDECELVKSNGQTFCATIAYKIIEVSEINFILVRVSDISERIHYKNKIEENRLMLRKVIDLVPHEIYLKDANSRFLFVNKIFLENHNLNEDEVLGKTDFEIFPEDIALKYVKDDEEVISNGLEKRIDADNFIDYKGRSHVLQITKMPFNGKDEEGARLLGISIDVSERVRDKQLIEENRKMLMEILNILPHNVYVKDKKGRFLLVNENTAERHKVTPEEMLGKTEWEYFLPEYAAKFEKDENEILIEGNARFIPEEKSIDNFDQVKFKNVIKVPFYLHTLRETGILAINIDITESKAAEKALKESELKYKMLMEQASDGIYLSDVNGQIIEANPKACEIFGFNMAEFLNVNIKELIDPGEAKDFTLKTSPYLDKQTIILERKFLKKDKTPITVELSARLLENGRHQGIIRDITERKKMEIVLQGNERKFRALIENSSDVIIIVSETFKVKFISASVKRILGYEPESRINRSLFEFIHPDAIDKVSKIFSETLLDPGNKHMAEELLIRNNREEFLCFEIVAVNLLADPNINGIILNCHDITKRKITETELINTNFELDSFVYKASHDLKAPLRSVMGLIRLAQIESKDNTLDIYLDKMNKSVVGLDSFIRDLTQFSRNSRLEIEPEILDFDNIISDSINSLKYMENADRIEMLININSSLLFYSDKTRVSTIINNLLSNAFKYHRFENNNPYINIKIEVAADQAVLIIEDNGIGIDPLYISRIFDMFYRASETSYGSGLGLYIVKNAVVKLGGTIEVESTLNSGTEFKIVIPNLINKRKE